MWGGNCSPVATYCATCIIVVVVVFHHHHSSRYRCELQSASSGMPAAAPCAKRLPGGAPRSLAFDLPAPYCSASTSFLGAC